MALETAYADTPSTPTGSSPVKPVAVVYFNDDSAIAKEHAQMIAGMVKEASGNFTLTIKEYPLKNEDDLSTQIEKIADDGTGLIIIIEPHNIDALSKIPSLYPDINFSIIGVNMPLYLANVRSMLFKDQEGAYMMGVLAALRSKTADVAFISTEDNEFTRNLAYAFLQGAKRGNADVQVTEQLGKNINHGTSNPSPTKTLTADNNKADIVFALDDESIENVMRNNTSQKRLIITYNHDLTASYPGVVLTSLMRHYDLAIYHSLRSYTRGEWRPGSQSMGIGNSFLDYVLNGSNKSLIPKETIEQLEMNKDYVTQSVVQINTIGK